MADRGRETRRWLLSGQRLVGGAELSLWKLKMYPLLCRKLNGRPITADFNCCVCMRKFSTMGLFSSTQKNMSAFTYSTYKTNIPNPLDDVRRVLWNPLDDVRCVLFLATPDLLTLPVCLFSHSQVESSESFADDVDRWIINFDDSNVTFRSKVKSNKSIMAGGEGVKIKRRSRLLRELQSSLDGVYWTGSTGPRRSKGSPAA